MAQWVVFGWPRFVAFRRFLERISSELTSMVDFDKTLLAKALELRPAQRLEFAQAVLSSLDEESDEIRQAWIDESNRRLAEYRRGGVKPLTIDEVFG